MAQKPQTYLIKEMVILTSVSESLVKDTKGENSAYKTTLLAFLRG
jgi:hypothetical protein